MGLKCTSHEPATHGEQPSSTSPLLLHSTPSAASSPASRWSCWYFLLKNPNYEKETNRTSSFLSGTDTCKAALLDKAQTNSHLPQQSHSDSQQQQPGDDAANDHSHGNVGLLSRFTDCQHHLDKRGPFKGLFRTVMVWLTKNSSCPWHSRDSNVIVLFLLYSKHCNQILLEAACGR